MNPILATVLSRGILPSERLTLLGAVGLLLGLGGVGLVASPDPADLLASDFIATGFVLLTAVSIALGSVLIQRVGSSPRKASSPGRARSVLYSCTYL